MNTQAVIVYRNPIEASFWEWVASGALIPVFSGIAVFIVCYMAFDIAMQKYELKGNTRIGRVALACSTGLALLTVCKLWG